MNLLAGLSGLEPLTRVEWHTPAGLRFTPSDLHGTYCQSVDSS